MFTATTITDHLGYIHYQVASSLTSSTSDHLPPDHPMRRFLTPFIYGTMEINREAYLFLSPKNGLAHRAFAFTYEVMLRALVRGIERPPITSFEEDLAARGVASLGADYPYAEDGRSLAAILKDYVRDYVELHYPSGSIVADPAVRAWWGSLQRSSVNSTLPPLESEHQLVDALANYVFLVVGFHGQVGNVAQYTVDPSFVGNEIREGETMSDVQAALQIAGIVVTTGLAQPELLGDYTHLVPNTHSDASAALMRTLQERLHALPREIGIRNIDRSQPFKTFDPAILLTSVST